LNSSIFKSQVNSRRESPVHKREYDTSVLQEIKVRDSMDGRFLILDSRTTIKSALDEMKNNKIDAVFFSAQAGGATEAGRQGMKVRVATSQDLLLTQDAENSVLDSLENSEASIVKDSDSLRAAFDLMVSSEAEVLAVTDDAEKEIVGKVSHKEIARTYHDRIHNIAAGGKDAAAR
jgi:CBS domain-containing protein